MLLDVLQWDILVQRAAVWLSVKELGCLMCASRQLAALRTESSLWRALFGRTCPCRTLQDDAPDWLGMLRLYCKTMARHPSDHLWLRVHVGNLLVPLPYREGEDSAALLLRISTLLVPSGRPTHALDVESNYSQAADACAVICMQQLHGSIGGEALLLLQNGKLVPGLPGFCNAARDAEGTGAGGEARKAAAPRPQIMGDLHLPAVADVLVSVLDPQLLDTCASDTVATQPTGTSDAQTPAAGARGRGRPEHVQRWLALKVLIPHFEEAGKRGPAGGGMGSPSKWRALANRAAGLDVGLDDGKGRCCIVWIRANAAAEELSSLLEAHTLVPRYSRCLASGAVGETRQLLPIRHLVRSCVCARAHVCVCVCSSAYVCARTRACSCVRRARPFDLRAYLQA